ncbi:MAG: hypothetical protein IIY48_07995 [Clostridia bacterium]|nr:hypothetical protein [Clostridia bacterium]
MSKIERIVERRWTYPGDRKTSWSYTVYYESGKRVQYSHNKNLPNNILHFILEADDTKVSYCEGWTRGSSYTVKKIEYRITEEGSIETRVKRTAKLRPYSVLFYTQRNRVLANWEYLAAAANKKQAIEQAREKWYNVRDEHMFNCRAERIDKIPEDRELYTFKTLNTKWATWGYRR